MSSDSFKPPPSTPVVLNPQSLVIFFRLSHNFPEKRSTLGFLNTFFIWPQLTPPLHPTPLIKTKHDLSFSKHVCRKAQWEGNFVSKNLTHSQASNSKKILSLKLCGRKFVKTETRSLARKQQMKKGVALHVFHRQLAHRVSGPRYQAKKKKRTWPTPTWLRYQAKKKETTWLTPTWLKYQAKKRESLAHSDLVQIDKPGQLYVAQRPSTKKREYLAHTNLAQIPSKIKGEHLAHSDLAQIPSKKKREHLAQKDIKQQI